MKTYYGLNSTNFPKLPNICPSQSLHVFSIFGEFKLHHLLLILDHISCMKASYVLIIMCVVN